MSDLMAGLMMVFLFISVSMMRYALVERDRIKEIAVAYQETQLAIYDALQDEFVEDLPRWGAQIDRDTLTITFQSPEIFFTRGSSELRESYKNILADFFPRYLLRLEPFSIGISEIRIEGHTSSRWNRSTTPDESYFRNMDLSQKRTRSVLSYIYGLPEVERYQIWIKNKVAAVGLSSSKLKYFENGVEDADNSRRVTFRVISNADVQIKKILNI